MMTASARRRIIYGRRTASRSSPPGPPPPRPCARGRSPRPGPPGWRGAAAVTWRGGGAAVFIPKPFRVRELLARVEAHLRVGKALAQAREEARSRAAMVDILHEVTDSLKPDEIYHILARRVARVLSISKCSMVLAKPNDTTGVVVAAYENPMLRNLEIELARYPEIEQSISTGRLVLLTDGRTDPLYSKERLRWERDRIKVPTRSAGALPFSMKDRQLGVFFLRTTGAGPP